MSMATKDRPAGRVLWSLDVGEKEKRAPPHQTLAMQMSFSYSSIGGTMAVIHGGSLIRYRVLGKACWFRVTESKVPPMSFLLAAAPPSSLIIHYCHLVPLKRRHMFREDCSLNHGGHEKTSLYGTCPTTTAAPSACLQALLTL